jgi:hypothetical protein
MGYSFCRFACGTPDEDMGSSDCDDGEWVWPAGLAHYVERHAVRLPGELIATMRGNCWEIPGDIVFSATRRKGVGSWRSCYQPALPDPRALVQPGWYGEDLEKILAYLNMKGHEPPRATLTGQPIRRLFPPTDKMSFWLTWARENCSAIQASPPASFPVVRREWLLTPTTVEEWLSPLESSGASSSRHAAQLRSEVVTVTRHGGQLWTWQFGSPRESGGARGLVVVRHGAVIAEWWLNAGCLAEFAGRSWLRNDGSVRGPIPA